MGTSKLAHSRNLWQNRRRVRRRDPAAGRIWRAVALFCYRVRNFGMRMIRTTLLAVALCCVAISAAAATANDFYLSLLRRGVSAFEAGDYAEATEHLRIAAFGFVDTIDLYETAQVHLAVAYQRLGDDANAANAVRRVFVAERVERRFARLPLSNAVRTAFDSLARKTLTAAEMAELTAPAAPSAAASTTPSPQTSQQSSPGAQTPAPVTPAAEPNRGQRGASQPAQQQRRQTEQPAATQPQRAAPAEEPRTMPPQASAPAERTPAETAAAPREPSTAAPQVAAPPVAAPAEKPAPRAVPPPPPPQPALSPSEIKSRLANAERALTSADLPEARRIYRELLEVPALERTALLGIAEGLYRARDFDAALAAFRRLGTLQRGEEPYGYYVAVALYETGDRAGAKRALASALPHIEITPDVAQYRARIEASTP